MRILLLSWEYPPVIYGGLGRHVHALAEALAAGGHEVTVLTQHSVDDPAPYEEVLRGVHVVRVPQDPPPLPRSDILAWVMGFNHGLTRAGLRVARDRAYDVIHAHDWLVAHAAQTLREALGLPLVVTVHATEAGRHQGWLPGPVNRAIHAVEWWLTHAAARVIACSAHMRWEVARLFGVPGSRLAVIPNGIDLADWQAPAETVAAARAEYAADGPLVVFSGRLVLEKGAQTLLEAVPRLRRRHPGLRVALAGDGHGREKLEELAERLRLGRSVRFVGWLGQEELTALVAAADVAVVPSLYEPFGLVALEAAAVGTPLVVGDTGGLREFVEHEVTGLRFPPGDPTALADAVTRLLRDPALGERLAQHARKVLERDHIWGAIAERTARVYEQALADPVPGDPPPLVFGEGNLLRDQNS